MDSYFGACNREPKYRRVMPDVDRPIAPLI